MARILYGVCGEGMGHAIRSAVVGRHLAERGHQLLFASSGSSGKYLQKHFRVIPIPGLTIAKRGNAIAPIETALQNVVNQAIGLFTGLPSVVAGASFRPDIVLSDFDPWSARVAHGLGVPLLAVDSIHFLSRCHHPREFLSDEAFLTQTVVRSMVPFAKHYFVTPLAFSYAPLASKNTTLHFPILRSDVLQAKTDRRESHLTVYLNDPAAAANEIDVLANSGIPSHVWTTRCTKSHVRGSVTELPFDSARFIRDLSTCRAAVGSAGALMGEAAYLGRPMLALPMGRHWEQHLNASYFERSGYGEAHAKLTPDKLDLFLSRGRIYESELRGLRHDGNRELLSAIDERLS